MPDYAVLLHKQYLCRIYISQDCQNCRKLHWLIVNMSMIGIASYQEADFDAQSREIQIKI